MLSLGGERLTPKVLDHYLHHDLGMLRLLWYLFAHLLISEYPDDHQNLIRSSLYYPGPLHKISSQSVHNFLSNVVHRQTDKPTLQKTLPAHSYSITNPAPTKLYIAERKLKKTNPRGLKITFPTKPCLMSLYHIVVLFGVST